MLTGLRVESVGMCLQERKMAEYKTQVCDLCKHEEKQQESFVRVSVYSSLGENAGKNVYVDVCPLCEDVIRSTIEKLKPQT